MGVQELGVQQRPVQTTDSTVQRHEVLDLNLQSMQQLD